MRLGHRTEHNNRYVLWLEFPNPNDIKNNHKGNGKEGKKTLQTWHPARYLNSLSKLTFFVFCFSLQKLVKESSHHFVMAALPAPPTHRAVSLLASSVLCFSRWLLFAFHRSILSMLPVRYLLQYKLSLLHSITIPIVVAQKLSFVRAHEQDWTYRQYVGPATVRVICCLN